jgi:hypothetical protein
MTAHHQPRAFEAGASCELFHLGESGCHDAHHLGLGAFLRPICATLEDGERGIEPRCTRSEQSIERLRLGPVEIGAREQLVRPSRRAFVGEHLLPIGFGRSSGTTLVPSDVTCSIPLSSDRDQLAGVEQFEVRRTARRASQTSMTALALANGSRK